jgi:hypothetical protein
MRARYAGYVGSLALLLVGCSWVPEGWECEPDGPTCMDGLACIPDCTRMKFFCGDGEPLLPPVESLGCTPDGVCRPDACETPWNCQIDCGLQCDVPALLSQPSADFLVSTVRVSRAREDVGSFSVDLDGDGDPDNALGSGLDYLADSGYIRDPNLVFAEAIASGRLLVAVRVLPSAAPGEGLALVQVLRVQTEGDATPLFDGSDRLVIAPGASRDVHLCAAWGGDTLLSDPGLDAISLPMPTPDASGRLPAVAFEGLRIAGSIDATGFQDVILAGGIPRSELRSTLVTAMVRYANETIQEDPTATVATDLLESLDGCPDDSSRIEGCETLTQGEGACSFDGVVTETEVRCHSIIDQVFRGDLPPREEGGEGRLSFGVRLDAVPAVIVE